MSGEKAYRKKLYSRYTGLLGMEGNADRAAIEARFPAFRAYYGPHLPEDKKAAILDAGCGFGPILHYLRKEGYAAATGVDASPEQTALAAKLGIPGVTHGDLFEHLKKSPKAFDLIFAVDLLEHLDKDEVLEFVELAAGALKPGGTLLAQTVSADGLGWGRMRYIDFTHEQAFTPRSLAQIFAACGLQPAGCYECAPVGGTFRDTLRAAAWPVLRTLLGLYFHIESGSGIVHNDLILTSVLLAKAVKA